MLAVGNGPAPSGTVVDREAAFPNGMDEYGWMDKWMDDEQLDQQIAQINPDCQLTNFLLIN
jgi:hypothetical protein